MCRHMLLFSHSGLKLRWSPGMSRWRTARPSLLEPGNGLRRSPSCGGKSCLTCVAPMAYSSSYAHRLAHAVRRDSRLVRPQRPGRGCRGLSVTITQGVGVDGAATLLAGAMRFAECGSKAQTGNWWFSSPRAPAGGDEDKQPQAVAQPDRLVDGLRIAYCGFRYRHGAPHALRLVPRLTATPGAFGVTPKVTPVAARMSWG